MSAVKRSDAFWRELHQKTEAAFAAGRKKSEILNAAGVRSNVYWYNCVRLGLKRVAVKGVKLSAKNRNGKFIEFKAPEEKPIEMDLKLGQTTVTLRLHTAKQVSEFISIMQADVVEAE